MRRTVAVVFGALCAILFAFAARAQELPLSPAQSRWLQAHPAVTIAVYAPGWPPFEEWRDGEPQGLSFDYLGDALARLGITPQYRVFESWPEMVRATCDGEVDLVMSVSITAERTQCLVFTREYAQVPVAVVARLADARPLRSADLKGLRIATERGFSTGEAARNHYPLAIHVDADTTLEALQAVVDGDADVYIGNAYVATALMQAHRLSGIGLIRVSELSTYPLHFAVPNGHRALAESINLAMQAIPLARREAIELKWLPDLEWINDGDSIFTAEEDKALSTPLLLGFPPQARPLVFRDDDGRPTGLVAEYLQRFEDMGARLQPLPAGTWHEVRAAMREGRVDAAVTVLDPLNVDRDWIHSLPIVSVPNVIVTRGDARERILELRDLSSARVATSDPERLEAVIRRTARGADVVRVEDPGHGLDLVRSRKADAYVGNLAVVDALIRERHAGELRIAAPAGVDDRFVLSARRRHAPVISAFDRMLVTMSPREREAIRGDWLAVEYGGGIDWRRIAQWLLPVLAALGAGVFIHARGYHRLRREVAQRRVIEQRFAEVTGNLPAVVYQATVSDSGEVTFPFVVGDLPSLFGLTIEEAMADGATLIARIDPEDQVRVQEAVRWATAHGEGIDLDFRALSDRGWRWVRSNSLPHRTDAHRWHWTGYWIDVTDQHRQWQDLLEAKSSAEEATRAKSDFLATMSHEIRTPMSGVVGLLEMLTHTPLDGEQRAIVGTIEDSAQVLRQILDDILDYSKLEAGALSLEAEPFNLRGAVHGVIRMLEPLSGGKQLRVRARFDAGVAEHHVGDDVRLRQILFNLLSNAIKFTERGGVEVAVALKDSNDDAQTIALTVSDTGIGIARERQAKLFQPFTQAESSTTRRYGGTGLGLSICQRITALMGGTIALESEAGKGTRVTVEVTLPVARVAAVAHAASKPPTPAALPPAADGRPMRVLIAEDHPTNRTLMAWYMQQLGLSYHMVENGAEALAALAREHYDLLITDGLMPVMNGYELAKAVRQREADTGGRRLPIIAITASAYRGEAELCSDAGMDGYLAKPVSLDVLARALRPWLQAMPEDATDATPTDAASPPREAPGDALLQSLFRQYGSLRITIEMLRGFCDASGEDIARLRTLDDGERSAQAEVLHRVAGGLYSIHQAALGDEARALEHRLLRTAEPAGDAVRAFAARLEARVAEIVALLASISA